MATKIRLKNAASDTLWPETDYSVLQNVPALFPFLSSATKEGNQVSSFTLRYQETYFIVANGSTTITIAGQTMRGCFLITNLSTKPKEASGGTSGLLGPQSATISLWSGGTQAVTGSISLGEYSAVNTGALRVTGYDATISSTGKFDVYHIQL